MFEETGIKAEFQSLICFREKVDYKWKADDIYFVCLLKPLTFEIQACEYEIKAAKWMKIVLLLIEGYTLTIRMNILL